MNPSWGDRYLVTCRLVMARYHESGLDDKAIHINMHDGAIHTSRSLATVDVGALGINSQHWLKVGNEGTAWENFCHQQGIPSKQIGLLFVGRINVLFGAWLSQRFIMCHQDTFHYQDTLFEWETYHKMLAVRPIPWALSLERVKLKVKKGD